MGKKGVLQEVKENGRQELVRLTNPTAYELIMERKRQQEQEESRTRGCVDNRQADSNNLHKLKFNQIIFGKNSFFPTINFSFCINLFSQYYRTFHAILNRFLSLLENSLCVVFLCILDIAHQS